MWCGFGKKAMFMFMSNFMVVLGTVTADVYGEVAEAVEKVTNADVGPVADVAATGNNMWLAVIIIFFVWVMYGGSKAPAKGGGSGGSGNGGGSGTGGNVPNNRR